VERFDVADTDLGSAGAIEHAAIILILAEISDQLLLTPGTA
jgi:hypothetical protein